MPTDADLRAQLQTELGRLRQAMPEIRGCLVASIDGLLVAHDTEAVLAEGVAALAAACLGVGQRIADSAGHEEFEEVLIRSSGGYAAMYLTDGGAVLVALASAEANVGLLNYEARRATTAIGRIVGSAEIAFAQSLPDAQDQPAGPARW